MNENELLKTLRRPVRRRTFIQRGGLLAAGVLLAPGRIVHALGLPAQSNSQQYDVAIIGAGMSGLVAARTLRRLGVDNIKVLEGRGRVGGRTNDRKMAGGGRSEDGGVWVGPTQDAILKEGAKAPYINLIAVRSADKDAEWVAKLKKAYHSDKVKTFVLETFKGAVVPAW